MKWTLSEWLRPGGNWARATKYWATVPLVGMLLLLAGIFCILGSFGLLLMLLNVRQATVALIVAVAVETGVFSVLLVWAAVRARTKAIFAVAIVHCVAIFWIMRVVGRGVPLTATSGDFLILEQRIKISAVVAMVLIFTGYILISAFLRREGLRALGNVTELRLATEIHRALVPAVSRTIGAFEFCGSSTPSGQMGGDLVDVIENGNRWTAYVADVSGHGVPAGMIMAMVKSAVRTGSTLGEDMAATLANLNRVLASLSAPNVFITLAYISSAGDSQVQFSLAGHLPILHYRKRLGAVEERSVSNLPLAVLADTDFQTASIDCEPGDLLAVLTDGFTEVSNSHNDELGLEAFKTALLTNNNAPLGTIITSLKEIASRHGKQTDDQTVLLVRRT